jgi:hypothetical protein
VELPTPAPGAGQIRIRVKATGVSALNFGAQLPRPWPGVPRLELDSELILAIVIPPLLYSACGSSSWCTTSADRRSWA